VSAWWPRWLGSVLCEVEKMKWRSHMASETRF
jgi:hypothetical protein